MSGKVKRIGVYSMILFITLLAWSIGLSYTQGIQELRNTVELRYTEEELSFGKVKKVITSEKENAESNIDSIVVWKQEKFEDVQNLSLQNTIQVDVLKVYGDVNSLVFSRKIIGESIGIGKTDEVLITKELAYKLWGSIDVVGEELFYKGKGYRVKGLIDDDRLLAVVPVEDDEEKAVFEGMRVKFLESENVKEKMQGFQSRHGLPEGIVIDLSLMSSLIGQLMLLPSWIMGILILAKFYKVICKSYQYWIACILLGIIGIGVTWIVINIIQFPVEIPSEWVPNKWSDFEFWSRLVSGLENEWLNSKSLPMSVSDLWIQEVIRGISINGVAVVIGFVVLIRRTQLEDLSTVFWKSLIAIVLTFIAILMNYYLGNEVRVIRALWLIWPSYMSIEYLLYRWKNYFEI